jgi:hypothetical protein
MDAQVRSSDAEGRRTAAAVAVEAMSRDGSEIYVPENVDLTCCLEESAKFCYIGNMICRVGMGISEIASIILSGISVTEIKDNPKLAWGLGLASTISSGASFGLTYASFYMENKAKKYDRAVAIAHQRRSATKSDV